MNELITIDPKKYGLEPERANSIAAAFQEPLNQMVELEKEFMEFENLVGEPSQEICAAAKTLKQKYVKIRTSTAGIHKIEKSVFRNAGLYVDAWKNKQVEIGGTRETKLSEISDYYINLEKAKAAELQEKRFAELSEFLEPELIPADVGNLHLDIYNNYLAGVKTQHAAKKEAERIAEETRVKAEQEAAAEQERIRKENERLKKEAAKKEKALAKERAENEQKLAAERAERERVEAKKEAEIEKERAAKEKLERLERERVAAEKKIQDEKKAAELKLKRGSDKEKLLAYVAQIRFLTPPEVSTPIAKQLVPAFLSVLDDLETDINRL